jgi:hypothetical protein
LESLRTLEALRPLDAVGSSWSFRPGPPG